MTNLGAFKLKAFRRGRRETCPDVEQARVTQGELGALVGVTHAMISRMEAGEKLPSLALATRLEDLGVCAAADWHRPARCPKCALTVGIVTAYCDERECPFAAWFPESVEQAA